MSIKIVYFASLRETMGRASDSINLANLDQTTLSVQDAWTQVTGLDEISTDVLIAVNQEYTSADMLLKEGDEVAFFPPVTGG